MKPILIVHGGAGDISDDRIPGKFDGMKTAIRIGYSSLINDDDPVTAVEKAVNVMENLPSFNAGYGSVLTETGEVEMDALIINGSDLSSGAVGCVRHIANPISLARKVMEKTKHVFLGGVGAEEFAVSQNIQLIPTKCLIPPQHCSITSVDKKLTETSFDVGTVGAIAINSSGNLAAATSTGGIYGKLNGRIGDTPLVGAGTWADENVGMSATGFGEAIIRSNLCSRIAFLMESGMDMVEACKKSLDFMSSRIPDSSGGVILINSKGEVAYSHNSRRLAWAYAKDGEVIHFGIDETQDFQEPIGSDPVQFPPPPKPDCDS